MNIINTCVSSVFEALTICALNTSGRRRRLPSGLEVSASCAKFSAPHQMVGELLVLLSYVPCVAANCVNENLGTTTRFYALEG